MRRGILILSLLAAACVSNDGVPGRETVGSLNGEPLLRADLELYFQVHLPDSTELGEAQSQPNTRVVDRVKSRLLDAFVRERTLLAEANRRGIRVSDKELETYLDLIRVEGYGVERLPLEARRRLAHTTLAVQKLYESIAHQVEPPTAQEVESFAEQTFQEPAAAGRRLLVRVLPFESPEMAREVYDDIRHNRATFTDAANAYELQPGQASPQELDWSGLAQVVRDALEGLRPGEVSAPLDYNGLIYLFQIQAWLEPNEGTETDRLQAAREELQRRKRGRAHALLLETLLQSNELDLHTERLGFTYIPEAAG
jgi:hypothetical protein